MTPRDWLKRLAFSFLIVAFAMFWRGQKQLRAGDQSAEPYLWISGACACVVLGLAGVRLRHARPKA